MKNNFKILHLLIVILMISCSTSKGQNLSASEQQEAMQAKYNELIYEGDLYFSKKEWIEAKRKYTMAAQIKSSERYPQEKIKEIEMILSNQNNTPNDEAIFWKCISKADDYSHQKEYEKATNLCKKVLSINCCSAEKEVARQKIEEVENLQPK